MAQKGFPENPKVGDTFAKSGKTYIFQGDKWVIKDDFAGPDPGNKDGQKWTNIRTKKTYTWDAKANAWVDKQESTTTTATTQKATTTTTAPKKTTTSTTNPPQKTTTTTQPPTTTTTPTSTTSTTVAPGQLPGGSTGVTKDYQADYVEAQNSAYGYLSSISRAQRVEFLNTLYSKGFGRSTKPTSGGLEPSDIEIAAQFYVYYRGNTKSAENPNGAYTTVNDAYKDINTWKTTTTAGASSFTPKLDVASAFRQVMQNDLGRGPTEEEIQRFYNAYHGLESGGNAPNIQSAAESQIAKTMTGESQAASFSNYASAFEQLMRGA